jgi:micrococcal nuclease
LALVLPPGKEYPPDTARVDQLDAAEKQAIAKHKGMWSACPDDLGKMIQPAPTVTTDTGAINISSGNCDPSYPTLCIPVGSPDLDCPDITARRFPVQPPDPMRFDGDHDGIGCEG